MLARTLPCGLDGVNGFLVEVEAFLSGGMIGFEIVGLPSAAVRERLWALVQERSEGGDCLIAYSANNEQGFCMEIWGNPRRTIVDFDGLQLIKIQQ